jgi:ribonuclease VapC
MTVIDTSALLAVVLKQEARDRILTALMKTLPPLLLSSVSLYEASIVLLMRTGRGGVSELNALLNALGVTVVSFDTADAVLAIEAYARYGKGIHPAGLNLGDCPVYALARLNNAPLLFVGKDFSQTDVAAGFA